MNLVALFVTEGDGYTFSCETFLGVFEDEVDAQAAIEVHQARFPNRYASDDYYMQGVVVGDLFCEVDYREAAR